MKIVVIGGDGLTLRSQLLIKKKQNEMKNFLFGPVLDPKTIDNGQDREETIKDFDPNEESLTDGGEYMDDALRMVEQPFQSNI